MKHAPFSFSPFGRALGGLFAGGVFGFVVEVLFFWDGPPESGFRLPVSGPLLGAAVVAVAAVAFGNKALPSWLGRLAAGVLGGVVAGVLGGAFVFAPLATSLDPAAAGAFRGKALAAYQRAGIVFAMPIGAVAGLAVAGVASWRRRSEKE